MIGFLPVVPAFYKWMTAPQYLRFAGSLVGLRGDTAALALAKPLSRGAFVLAKWLSQLLVIAVAAVVATAVCIALTAVLLGVGPVPETVAAVALWFVYAIVILSAMVLLSAVLPAPAAAAGAGIGVYASFAVLAQFEATSRITPAGLMPAAQAVLSGEPRTGRRRSRRASR